MTVHAESSLCLYPSPGCSTDSGQKNRRTLRGDFARCFFWTLGTRAPPSTLDLVCKREPASPQKPAFLRLSKKILPSSQKSGQLRLGLHMCHGSRHGGVGDRRHRTCQTSWKIRFARTLCSLPRPRVIQEVSSSIRCPTRSRPIDTCRKRRQFAPGGLVYASRRVFLPEPADHAVVGAPHTCLVPEPQTRCSVRTHAPSEIRLGQDIRPQPATLRAR